MSGCGQGCEPLREWLKEALVFHYDLASLITNFSLLWIFRIVSDQPTRIVCLLTHMANLVTVGHFFGYVESVVSVQQPTE